MSEKFENINDPKKKKERKKTDNDLHNTTEKIKDLATEIQQQKCGVK